MSSRNIGASLLSRRAWRAVARSMQKRSRMLIVSLLVLTSCMTILGINPFSQHAKAQASPRVTVAAIDPSLVAGRGAQLGIVQQEAENATTNGTILPFDTSAYTLSGEASGRQAVQLTGLVEALNDVLRFDVKVGVAAQVHARVVVDQIEDLTTEPSAKDQAVTSACQHSLGSSLSKRISELCGRFCRWGTMRPSRRRMRQIVEREGVSPMS